VDKADAKGLELDVEGRLFASLQGRLSYSFQEAIDQTTERLLTNSPKQLAKGSLTVPLLRDKIFATAEVQYISWRNTVSGVKAPPSITANIGLFCRNLVEGLEASVHVYNFLDRQNMDPASAEHKQALIPQDGQSVRLKVSYTY